MKVTVIMSKDNQLLVSSKDVAKEMGKDHMQLMEEIKGYSKVLDSSNFKSKDFFIGQDKKDSPFYLLTMKGYAFVMHKSNIKECILFTAEYVTVFEKMEAQAEDLQNFV